MHKNGNTEAIIKKIYYCTLIENYIRIPLFLHNKDKRNLQYTNIRPFRVLRYTHEAKTKQ
jgi:hypothetical protein